jgi:Outer membrane protein beta-barrel domain
MTIQRSLLALGSLLALASLAAPAVAWCQPYGSVEIGYARANFPLGPPYNGVVDDRAPMLGLEGGFAFGKWGAELGLHEFGTFDGYGTPCVDSTCTTVTEPINGNDEMLYKVALVRRFEIGNVRLYGKAGYYNAKIKSNVPDGDFRADGVMLGAGVRWYFSGPWSMSLEGERFDDNISQVAVGFGWGFGRDTHTED